jgi:hypothetical protein
MIRVDKEEYSTWRELKYIEYDKKDCIHCVEEDKINCVNSWEENCRSRGEEREYYLCEAKEDFMQERKYRLYRGGYTVKKRLSNFPSPAGMSLTKLLLAGNY